MEKKELELSTCHVEYDKETLEIEYLCPVDNVYTYIYPSAEDINKLYLFLKDIVELHESIEKFMKLNSTYE